MRPPHVLSNLHDNVILMRLPLRDVVRTSILSKRWRYKYWCSLPQLKRFGKTTEDIMCPIIGFTSIVYPFLALHTGHITKFTLDIPDLQGMACHILFLNLR
ncbi:hypothetical protein P3S68_032936 [Capsicum galapagoense]